MYKGSKRRGKKFQPTDERERGLVRSATTTSAGLFSSHPDVINHKIRAVSWDGGRTDKGVRVVGTAGWTGG